MALTCWRCAGYTELDHARDCPHRTTPVPPVVELSWPRDEDGKPVTPQRALELVAALDAATRTEALYWVSFASTDDPDLDAETTILEDGAHSLEAIRRLCLTYGVGAVYGDEGGALGAVTEGGQVVPGAAEARAVATRRPASTR